MQKRIVILAVGASLAMPAVQAAGLSLDQLVACAAITESSARLACYDREVAPLARQIAGPTRPANVAAPVAPAVAAPPAAPPAAPAAPAVPAPPAARAPAATPSTFGQEQLAVQARPAAREEERTLHARLTSQSPAGGGNFNLYLDNGQVWRHQDLVQGPYLKDGDAITIEKGALGSYKLSRDAGKARNWIRVTRVR